MRATADLDGPPSLRQVALPVLLGSAVFFALVLVPLVLVTAVALAVSRGEPHRSVSFGLGATIAVAVALLLALASLASAAYSGTRLRAAGFAASTPLVAGAALVPVGTLAVLLAFGGAGGAEPFGVVCGLVGVLAGAAAGSYLSVGRHCRP